MEDTYEDVTDKQNTMWEGLFEEEDKKFLPVNSSKKAYINGKDFSQSVIYPTKESDAISIGITSLKGIFAQSDATFESKLYSAQYNDISTSIDSNRNTEPEFRPYDAFKSWKGVIENWNPFKKTSWIRCDYRF